MRSETLWVWASLLQAASKVLQMWYQLGNSSCLDLGQEFSPFPGVEPGAWHYQRCTEIILPLGSSGIKDMYFHDPWDEAAFLSSCRSRFPGIVPRPRWGGLQFWGFEISSASNIVFTSGTFDPWAAGGVDASRGPLPVSVEAVWIERGAHHLDFRSPDSRDPPSVAIARQKEEAAILRWIQQKQRTQQG